MHRRILGWGLFGIANSGYGMMEQFSIIPIGMQGNPLTLGHTHICINATSGKWFNTYSPYTCHYPDLTEEQMPLSPFICKATLDYSCDDLSNDACKCAKDWSYLNTTNSCYKAFSSASQIRYFFDELETLCNIFPGGHSVSIHSKEENEFVKYMATLDYAWKYVWIGLEKHGNKYTWTDETPYDYNNFLGDQFENLTDSYITLQACTYSYCGNDTIGWGSWQHNPPSSSLLSTNNGYEDGSNAVCKMPSRKNVV